MRCCIQNCIMSVVIKLCSQAISTRARARAHTHTRARARARTHTHTHTHPLQCLHNFFKNVIMLSEQAFFPHVFIFLDKLAGSVIGVVVHRLYKGIFYFQNIIKFYDTRSNVIQFMPIRKVRLPCADLHQTLLNNIPIQQDAVLHSLFYPETALHVSGGTTTHHLECKQLYLQHLVFFRPLV